MSNKTVRLNDWQKAVVNFNTGPAVCMASPGSGKTVVIVQRILRLRHEGVPLHDILSLTFTKEGAAEMRKRADLPEDVRVFSTFHSWALSFIKREAFNLPFKVKTDWHGNPSPLCLPPEVARTLAQLCAKSGERMRWKDVGNFISLMKRRGISPAQAWEAIEHDGEERFIGIYAKYEQALREKGVMDFDSIVIETANLLKSNAEVRGRNQYRFVQIDEAQDTDACQPPGTLVKKVVHFSKGKKSSVVKDVPIETLKDGDRVVAWKRRHAQLLLDTKPISVGVRHFSGELLELVCGEKKTRVTPDHRLYVTMNGVKDEDCYYVYLMYRHDLGFRVGQCAMRYSHNTKKQRKSMGGLGARFVEEKADLGWVLRVEKTKESSQAWEQIIACNYGIPYATYKDKMKVVFENTKARGRECLSAHGLLFEHPLFMREQNGNRKSVSKRYFETVAANVIPGMMSLPSTKSCSQTPVDAVRRVVYDGPVYSLNVPEHHTYVADGLVVKNCQWSIIKRISERHGNVLAVGDENQGMYSWRGSENNLTKYFCNLFPGAKVFPLPVNYRSTKSIVEYCQEIAPTRNESIENLSTPNEQGVQPTFRLYGREDEEARAIVGSCMDLGNTAVLTRTNRQLLPFEIICTEKNLRYKLLGKSGYWAQREVKDTLAIIGSVVFPTDANILRMLVARCTATKWLRKSDSRDHKSITTALKDFQAAQHEKTCLSQLLLRYQNDGAETVRNIAFMLKELRAETSRLNGGDGVRRILDCFGVLAAYDEADEEAAIDNDPRENIQTLITYANKKKSAREFYEWALKVQHSLRARTDCLTMGTIHSAKGKEWPRVFVAGVNRDVLPHINGELQEEKQIFFVACSRAAEHLHVSANGVPSELIEHKLTPENEGRTIDPWEGFELLREG